ncbi:MAG: UDP-N-acetylmuramoyl-tripeptide--D-alanyl-D-alanine ligase [Endomicrobia bacterium]|nr:UDP-N-acetylmuramoyl-tripeptide--D-alanyl-D-alanine ligase [Endomicrobiia bacterium]MCL2506665.1 UDP-N-acetylmuramoyl-tripeptide--D-alanyl-D-alanine ligase [Endomicrobiia bacterium]
MEAVYLKDLIKIVKGKFLIGDPNLLVKNITIDSRTVRKGQVFFAIKGRNYDGHDFIKEAIERGADAIIYSREEVDFAKPFPNFSSIIKVEDTLVALGEFAKAYRERFKDLKVIGITGSNGKTTTKEMLASILRTKNKTVSNKGNFNNRIGLPLSLFELDSETKYGVFEAGTSLFGEIKILADILQPDVAIVTNIGFSHLETFGSPQGVFREKRDLFDSVSEDGFVVINNDDEILKKIPHKMYPNVMTFALYGGADVYANNVTLWSDKPRFTLNYGTASVEIMLPVKGKFNILNALAASSAALGLGYNMDDVKAGIESFTPPAMRMETFATQSGITLINDAYNANPSSVREAIQGVCDAYIDSDINLVLGDMLELGPNSDEYHFELGNFINSQRIKSVYLMGDMTAYTKEAISKTPVYHAKDANALFKILEQTNAGKKSVFLFKASRSMNLDEVCKNFFVQLEKRKK